VYLVCPAGPFLSDGQRYCVHQVGAPDLDHIQT
jgi:hypothetical protein